MRSVCRSQGGGEDQALPRATGGSDRGAGHFGVRQPGGPHQLLREAPAVPQDEATLPHQ